MLSTSLLLLSGLLIHRDYASSSPTGYYCPSNSFLEDKKCYDFHIDSLTKRDAETVCENDGGKRLPNVVNKWLTGWLDNSTLSSFLPDSEYCVLTYPNPMGNVTPGDIIFQLAPCSTKLSVICSVGKTSDSCMSGWWSVTLGDVDFCWKISDRKSVGGKSLSEAAFVEEVCSCDSCSVFEFNYKNQVKEKTISEPRGELLQSFWTPFYWSKGQTNILIDTSYSGYDWFEKIPDIESCLFMKSGSGPYLGPCTTSLSFYCESDAKRNYEPPESEEYDAEITYQCEDGGILCENKCFQHRKIYKSQAEAALTCANDGYKLVSRNVACIGYQAGWVGGNFIGGSSSVSSALTLANICAYLEIDGKEGVVKLGDCRRSLHALCVTTWKDGDTCNGVTMSPNAVPMGEARDNQFVCDGSGGGSSLVSSRKALQAAVKCLPFQTTTPTRLWIGAQISQGGVMEFINGELLNSTDESVKRDLELPCGPCLQVLGGMLFSADCGDQMYFACEKPASERQKDSVTNRAIIIVLIVLPLLTLAILLFVLYRKKGSQMFTGSGGNRAADAVNATITLNQLVEDDFEIEVGKEAIDEKKK